jgi:hypothetical protein
LAAAPQPINRPCPITGTPTGWTSLGPSAPAGRRTRPRALAPKMTASLREIRESTGRTQTAAAAAWGRSQSQVARVEGLDLARIKLGTLADYVEALGGTVTVTVTIDGTTLPLVGNESTPTAGNLRPQPGSKRVEQRPST